MHFSTLASLLFAALAAASPVKRDNATEPLIIRAWNTSTFDCDYMNPHLKVEMLSTHPFWAAIGNYDSYSLSRDLVASETLQLFEVGNGDDCETLLYPVVGIKQGPCYHATVANQTFTCMSLAASS